MATTLFLLKPDFLDHNTPDDKQLYFCPQCATVEGILQYYPIIKDGIEIVYVDFKRPRPIIIDRVGEENQGCPLLVIDKTDENEVDTSYFQSYGDKLFVNSVKLISKYFAEKFNVGITH